jgi:D-tyrosyl-tRNA(Tyr) deacylase
MRVIIQRVSKARVTINGKVKSEIEKGLLVLLGIEDEDREEDGAWLASKISKLRIFNDAQGLMNVSVQEVGGEVLLVSQFTLFASTAKGNRPSYIRASKPEQAIPLYEKFIEQLTTNLGRKIFTGSFGADMQIELVNDGPVTMMMDTRLKE